MIRFSKKNVVVEVKHPRKLKKSNSSIWDGIDLSKHSMEINDSEESETLTVAPPELSSNTALSQSDTHESTAVRILEDQTQLAALNEEAEKTLAQAELEDEDFWDSHFSLVRKSSNSNEEVSFLQSNVDPIEVNENETSDVSAVEPPADGVTQQHDLFSETPSPVVALNDQERDFGELTQTSDLVVQATETPTPEVIADAHVPVVETAMNETVSIASDDTDNDGEPIESYTVAVAESFKAGSTTGIRKIPGVRYVRRPDGLKVAREHRWKVRRLYRDRHF